MIYKTHVGERQAAQMRRNFPWLFKKDLHFKKQPPHASLVAVYDKKNKRVGIGLYDAHSPIAVRLLNKEAQFGEAYIAQCLVEAHAIRTQSTTFHADNNAYRVCNGESEGLPGIVIDNYNGSWVLKIYTTIWLEHLQSIIEIIKERFAPARLVLRFSRNARPYFEAGGFKEASLLWGDDAPYALFTENGANFQAQIFKGQKTGFFLDQRDNRLRIRELARGRRVLDLCSFNGGFSINAAIGGATAVWSIDQDKMALTQVSAHYAMNEALIHAPDQQRVQQREDVFRWLTRAKPQAFDLIIADPPSFASSKAGVQTAINSYKQLFNGCARVAAKNAKVLCCSCSSRISHETFETIIRESIGRPAKECENISALPLDHTANFREAQYLKAWLITL